ncbi:MAG TPA: PDZ domain-containing protein [Phycisphaerae bacterium]|nr:PDZ domain-containing protein [Phycisphaerales bacterium]HRX85234.1 PDZ domain-containing protein [Phycisphaerae bacterium]
MTRTASIRFARLAATLPVLAGAATASAQAPPVLPPPAPQHARPHAADFDEQDINLGAADADADRVTRLVTQLGSPKYPRREEASAALTELCPGAFRQLAEAYRTTDDFETRIRIQEIVQQQYLWHTLLKHKGFLGVSLPPTTAASLPDGTYAVPVGVQAGSAADAAGLRDHDLIHAIDGHVFTKPDASAEFRELIQDKGADSKVKLEVLRGGRVIEIEATLRARPIENYDGPELLDELNSCMQAYTVWWGQYFSLPAPRAERTPSTTVLELPE